MKTQKKEQQNRAITLVTLLGVVWVIFYLIEKAGSLIFNIRNVKAGRSFKTGIKTYNIVKSMVVFTLVVLNITVSLSLLNRKQS